VLTGSRDQRILKNGHDKLSTYGLLAEIPKRAVRDWIEQLVAQGYLAKTGDFNVLKVTPSGRQVLRGETTPRLLKAALPGKRAAKASRSRCTPDSWEGVARDLFEVLKDLRREIAARKRVPAYVVFSDASLRDMARQKPATPEAFLGVHGVGAVKCRQYAETFLAAIRAHGVGP